MFPGNDTGSENGSVSGLDDGGAMTSPADCAGTAYLRGSGATSGIVNTTSDSVGYVSLICAPEFRRTCAIFGTGSLYCSVARSPELCPAGTTCCSRALAW